MGVVILSFSRFIALSNYSTDFLNEKIAKNDPQVLLFEFSIFPFHRKSQHYSLPRVELAMLPFYTPQFICFTRDRTSKLTKLRVTGRHTLTPADYFPEMI